MTNSYPDEEDLLQLKQDLNTSDFMTGAQALHSLMMKTDYARCLWLGKVHERIGLEVVTGGWSGCEKILEATHGTLWRSLYWDSTHRGGLERFVKRD